ncbi:MAG: SDR family NAD(P)-dependent oxidoreductase [Acidobacteria bacterium]|nr:SDR family NAD(P)-dependent oxidoreductase [Acidobacteriota bacterium]MBI3425362.1 SDR family NAD(P)-dependent oxidoreductase [Acidobacteriota bacterium]
MPNSIKFDFTNQVVVITGAAGNLGVAVAHAYQKAGAKLVLLDRSPDRLQKLFADMAASPDHHLATGVDVTDAAAVAAVAAETANRFGRVDALINTAGGYRAGTPVHETPLTDWDFLMDLNGRSVFNTCRAFAPQLLQQGAGKIVNIASRGALAGEAGAALYSASKSVVIRLTESLSAELKPHGINVNCVLPGLIDTPPNRAAMPNADYSRWVTPEALAEIILFLTSDAASAIHGAAIPAYGRA